MGGASVLAHLIDSSALEEYARQRKAAEIGDENS
jgi:hypothetical protein